MIMYRPLLIIVFLIQLFLLEGHEGEQGEEGNQRCPAGRRGEEDQRGAGPHLENLSRSAGQLL